MLPERPGVCCYLATSMELVPYLIALLIFWLSALVSAPLCCISEHTCVFKSVSTTIRGWRDTDQTANRGERTETRAMAGKRGNFCFNSIIFCYLGSTKLALTDIKIYYRTQHFKKCHTDSGIGRNVSRSEYSVQNRLENIQKFNAW